MSQPDLHGFYIREIVMRAIRDFFTAQQFHEVLVPVFNRALPLEPNLFSFSTEWHKMSGHRTFFLTISPESGIKKMLAKGLGNCFAIGKCFRNLEDSGHKHNPEFLMLEWYRHQAHYADIMRDTQALLLFILKEVKKYEAAQNGADKTKLSPTSLMYQGKEIDLGGEWPVLSLVDLLQEYAHVEMADIIPDEAFMKLAREKGYQTDGATWSQLFDQLFLNEIEDHLPTTPYFLVDFPAKMSPLCKVNLQRPYLAERFEFSIGGMELGNGNNENTDDVAIRQHFEEEAAARTKAGLPTHPIDQDFLAALHAMNTEPYAGIGVGVDRLAMLMADTTDIHDVEPLLMSDSTHQVSKTIEDAYREAKKAEKNGELISANNVSDFLNNL